MQHNLYIYMSAGLTLSAENRSCKNHIVKLTTIILPSPKMGGHSLIRMSRKSNSKILLRDQHLAKLSLRLRKMLISCLLLLN